MQIKSTMSFGGKSFETIYTFTKDFTEITEFKQCIGFVLNSQKEILFISEDGIKWNPPGGTRESNETPEETLIREIYEEAAVKIRNIRPFFIQENFFEETGELEARQLRFIATVETMDEFTADPGGNVLFRKFVPLSELEDFLRWGEIGKVIKRELEKIL